MQLIDAGVVAVFGFAMAYVWFKVSDLITPVRVSRSVELEGLDSPEMGALAYPDHTLNIPVGHTPKTGEAAACAATNERERRRAGRATGPPFVFSASTRSAPGAHRRSGRHRRRPSRAARGGAAPPPSE